MTDPWTLFTSDRWVLYNLMSIVSCTLLWMCSGALIILWCGVWMSSVCTVLLLWARHHFSVTWMSIVTCVLADFIYWSCREIYSVINPPKSSLMLKLLISRHCWEPVCGIICALYAYGCVCCNRCVRCVHVVYSCLLKALTETPRYATIYTTNLFKIWFIQSGI